MPDIAAISAFLGSLKHATDLAKFLKAADASVAQAELKFKTAELIEALTEAKMSAAELQEVLRKRDEEISRLTKALALKAEVVKDGDAYFRKDDQGEPSGEPFCVHCWEIKSVLAHLVRDAQSSRQLHCPNCGKNYNFFEIPQHQEKKG
jgi:hypothetical protein